MKTYVKAQVVAKNNPQGSYAAGCPVRKSNQGIDSQGPYSCKSCERTY